MEKEIVLQIDKAFKCTINGPKQLVATSFNGIVSPGAKYINHRAVLGAIGQVVGSRVDPINHWPCFSTSMPLSSSLNSEFVAAD